jgi:low temperature requirement protein LtrA
LTRFDVAPVIERLFTFLQIAIIATMAVNVHHGLGDSSVGFALSYAASQVILIIQYLFAGTYIREARPLCNWFAIGFGISVFLWIVSVFVPIPWRFALWALGILVDLATPLVGKEIIAKLPFNISHVPERLGLFTIIVLGESAVGVVSGVAEQEWQTWSLIASGMGLLIAFSLWWLYFDNIDGTPLGTMQQGRSELSVLWVYAHLPLAISVAAIGVGVEHFVSWETDHSLPVNERWLLCGAIALCLLMMAAINWIVAILSKRQDLKIVSFYRLGSVAFALVLGLAANGMSVLLLISLLTLACLVQVGLELWVNSQFKAEANKS